MSCVLALFSVGLFAVMMVKTAHKDYPKQEILDLLKYDEKKKLCPKDKRGEHVGFSRDYAVDAHGKKCTVLAAGHNSKKPVLLVATASNLTKADDYKKTWTRWDATQNKMIKITVLVATTMVLPNPNPNPNPNPYPNPNPNPSPSPNQFTSTLDLLEDFLAHKEYKYCRLDGSTNRVQRTVDINSFNMPGSSKVRLRLRRRRT